MFFIVKELSNIKITIFIYFYSLPISIVVFELAFIKFALFRYVDALPWSLFLFYLSEVYLIVGFH